MLAQRIDDPAKPRVFFILLCISLRFLFDLFYLRFSEDFAYYGMLNDPRSSLEIIISWLAVIGFAYFIKLDINQPSNTVHIMLFLICFIPASVNYSWNSGHPDIGFYGLCLAFALIPILKSLLSQAAKVNVPTLTNNQLKALLLTLIICSLGAIIVRFGVITKIPTLENVYAQRDLFKMRATTLDKYIIDWLAYSINITLILYGMVNRKYWMVMFGLALSVYLFGLGGHKSYLFGASLATGLYFLVRLFRKDFNIVLALGLSLACFSLFVFDLFFTENYSLASSIFIRRTLLLPSQIYFHYVDYFMINDLNYFSHNFPFRLFMTSGYDQKIPEIIGSQYFTFKEGIYANGNVFADAYSNIGVYSFGMIAFLLALLYQLIDWVSQSKTTSITLPLIFLSTFALLNSGFIVTFVTHGLWLTLLLILLIPGKQIQVKAIS